MNIFQLMLERHSVRQYADRTIEPEKAAALQQEVDAINAESGLAFALITQNEEVFKANKPSYGAFSGCRNLFALYGPRGSEQQVGYYGQRLVLFSQGLGLNTCWVALTYEKSAIPTRAPAGMKLQDVIALGYGVTPGVPHRSKPAQKLAQLTKESPVWFVNGVRAAMLAPTAINQQRFYIRQVGERGVQIKGRPGPCYKTDLGIVKYHFEQGAGKEYFDWVE